MHWLEHEPDGKPFWTRRFRVGDPEDRRDRSRYAQAASGGRKKVWQHALPPLPIVATAPEACPNHGGIRRFEPLPTRPGFQGRKAGQIQNLESRPYRILAR